MVWRPESDLVGLSGGATRPNPIGSGSTGRPRFTVPLDQLPQLAMLRYLMLHLRGWHWPHLPRLYPTYPDDTFYSTPVWPGVPHT